MDRTEELTIFPRILAPACFVAFGLAACLDTPDQEEIATEEVADVERSGMNSAALLPLTSDDLEAAELEGELGCSFTTDPAASPLLVATGFVADDNGYAQFAAGTADAILRGEASQRGGYDEIIDGAEFSADGSILTVSVTGEPAPGSVESPPVPAELRVDVANGAGTTIPGFWTCGP